MRKSERNSRWPFGLTEAPTTVQPDHRCPVLDATLSLDDLFLVLFVTIDDLYEEIAPVSWQRRPGHHRLRCTDSEILTLSLVQEALSMDSETSFHRFIEKNYRALFPGLPSRDRYHRRRKALLPLHQRLFQHLAQGEAAQARYGIIDSAPVETAAFVRSQSASVSVPEAAYGFLPSKKRVFFGFRLHALVSEHGAVVDFALAAANASERLLARELLPEGTAALADSGYDGEDLASWAGRRGVELMVQPRPGRAASSREEARYRRWLRGRRQLVETVFGMLSDQFRLATTRARSAWGIAVRVVAKLAAYNMSLLLNRQLGRPVLAVKSLYL